MSLADAGTPEQIISTYFRSRLTYHSACVNPPPGVIGTFQPLYNCLVKLAIKLFEFGKLMWNRNKRSAEPSLEISQK